jgi:arabinan endo-1,5-alpha-L-arabinosidase
VRRRWIGIITGLACALAVTGPAMAAPELAGLASTGGTAVAGGVAATAGAPTIGTGTYRNPLPLSLPDGHHAESCADPTAIHGQQPGDTHWYLYCTSDVLDSSETGPDGSPVVHTLPTFTSTDLVHWSFVGDAVPDSARPAWATGFLWAPDIVWTGQHYLLYFAVSDTSLPGGGAAIGVATSTGPTGPWSVSATPAVAPEDAQCCPGSRRSLLDPEVVTDGGTSYIYFGSYFGGISARTLSADGLTSEPASEVPIAIDNRYEGSLVVRHGGWWYLMASATNCCNGPLTGYAVFAARSRSPLGPFADRDGVSVLAGRVGGTPVLAQNGNRWVGPGHNTVVTDFAGQDWTIYHAVDRDDPYYAGQAGYTKRPGMLDPLDWVDGWPTVRGGAGPSDRPVPAPAAQPAQAGFYSPVAFSDPRPGALVTGLSDDFSGSSLSPQWSWVRQPSGGGAPTVAGGALSWGTQSGDLQPPAADLASVLTEPAPSGNWMVETKVRVDTPPEGCCQNYVQGGLVAYQGDGQYVKLTSVSIWNTRQTEMGRKDFPAPAGYPSYGNSVVGPVGDWTWLRLVHRQGVNGDTYTAYTSLDGTSWDRGATWRLDGPVRIGLVSMGGSGFTTTFDSVHVSRFAD